MECWVDEDREGAEDTDVESCSCSGETTEVVEVCGVGLACVVDGAVTVQLVEEVLLVKTQVCRCKNASSSSFLLCAFSLLL